MNTFSEFATEAVERKGADTDAAVAYALRKLDQDPAVKAALVPEALRLAVTHAVWRVHEAMRCQTKWSAPDVEVRPGPDRYDAAAIKASRGVEVRSFLRSWPLNGKMLADCTWEELAAAEAHEWEQVRGRTAVALFYGALKKIAREADKLVGEAVTDARADKIWRRCNDRATAGPSGGTQSSAARRRHGTKRTPALAGSGT